MNKHQKSNSSLNVKLGVQVLLLVGGLGLFAKESQATKVSVPAFTAPIVDQVGILNADTSGQLNQIIRKLYRDTGIQIGVLGVSSLEGLSIEEYSIEVASTWQLGKEKDDRGLLLVVAPNERRVRFEVGRGLEGELTDLQSGRIINDVMIPYFKKGDWNGGVSTGVLTAISQIAPEFLKSLPADMSPPKPKRNPAQGKDFGFAVLALLFFLFLLMRSGGGGGGGLRRRGGVADALILTSLLGNSRRSYGGGGGSSWGSFGGGGGSFGGGGASGSW